MKDDGIIVIASTMERDILYKNHSLYFHNQKYVYQIEEDRGVLFKDKNIDYYELLLQVELPKDKKYNEVFEFSIQEEKRRMITLLKALWEGD